MNISLKDMDFSLEEVDFFLEEVDFFLKEVDFFLKDMDFSLKEVDFSMKEMDISLKEVDFSLKEMDFSLKEVDFSLKVVDFSLNEEDLSDLVLRCSISIRYVMEMLCFKFHGDWASGTMSRWPLSSISESESRVIDGPEDGQDSWEMLWRCYVSNFMEIGQKEHCQEDPCPPSWSWILRW